MKPNSTQVEKWVLSKVVETGLLAPVLEVGVTTDWFKDSTHRRIFQRMLALQTQHGHLSLRMLHEDFPEFTFVRVPEPWDFLLDALREGHVYYTLDVAFGDLVEKFTDPRVDSTEIQNDMSMLLKEILDIKPQAIDTNLATKEVMDDRIERYTEWAENKDNFPGIRTGFNFIDQATRGYQAGHLITLVGEAKAGKTSAAILSALAATKQRKKVMFVSFEMTEEEISSRLDAFRAGVSLRGLTHGDIIPRSEDFKQLTRAIHEYDTDFIISNDTSSVMTLTGLAAKIDEYQPDIVFVDGTYMMQDENGEPPGTPRAITNITRGLKRLAQNKMIPIVQTTQILEWKVDKKRGITAGSIGYSSSFAQDSTLILGVERDEEDPDIRRVKVVLGRHVPAGLQRRIRWDFDHGKFEELEDEAPEDEDDSASY